MESTGWNGQQLNSPDLNPIEHLWDELGRAVRKRVTDQTTLADLHELLVEEWDVIPQQRVRTLVNSMRRRCQAVINAFGVCLCLSAVIVS